MSKTTVPLRFEFLEDTREGKIWKIEALHVTTTKNRRKYTEQELREGARSLSWRPLNINHNEAALLPYPENTTLEARYEPAIKGVVGRMRIADEVINSMIESGRINRLSVEQLPVLGESCDSVACEQHGVTFVGLALLTNDTTPGDGATRIMAESKGKKQEMMMVPFTEIVGESVTAEGAAHVYAATAATSGSDGGKKSGSWFSRNFGSGDDDDDDKKGGDDDCKWVTLDNGAHTCIPESFQEAVMVIGDEKERRAVVEAYVNADHSRRQRREEQAIKKALLEGLQQK